jgi:gentisate 1,2-dioxygenase
MILDRRKQTGSDGREPNPCLWARIITLFKEENMEVKVIQTYKEAEQLWLGLEETGLRRKVFRAVDEAQLEAKRIVAGLTIFEPGEECAPHNHPGSEEINFIVQGTGIAVDVTHGKETRFKAHDFIFIPEDVEHIHRNDGEESLLLLWAYAPPGQLPTR